MLPTLHKTFGHSREDATPRGHPALTGGQRNTLEKDKDEKVCEASDLL